MENGCATKSEKSLSAVLSENIRRFLSLNKMTQKMAADLAGIRTTTLNSWILGVSYPREDNLRKLADVFHVDIVDLTGDVEAADERRRYLTIGASDMLSSYNTDKYFQRWCELGLRLRRENRLRAYVQKLEEKLMD